MISFKYKTVEIPYKKEFSTSHGSKTKQKFLYIELGVGVLRGYGATPYIEYSTSESENWTKMLESKSSIITRYAYNGPERFWHFLQHHGISGVSGNSRVYTISYQQIPAPKKLI